MNLNGNANDDIGSTTVFGSIAQFMDAITVIRGHYCAVYYATLFALPIALARWPRSVLSYESALWEMDARHR